MLETAILAADVILVIETDQAPRWRLAPAGWIAALLLVGCVGWAYGAIGCSENLSGARESVCTTTGLAYVYPFEWITLASAPAVLFALALILVPPLRRHPNLAGAATLTALVVIDGLILAAAAGNFN